MAQLLHDHLAGKHVDSRIEGCPACGALPAARSEGGSPPTRADKRPPHPRAGGMCGCGCGAPVTRRFLPGHDAKLKSQLVRAAREGDTPAADRLKELGWERFI